MADCRSTCLMRPTSSRLWALMKVLRPACRSAFAQPLEVDKQPEAAERIAAARERRIVRDLDQFKHGDR